MVHSGTVGHTNIPFGVIPSSSLFTYIKSNLREQTVHVRVRVIHSTNSGAELGFSEYRVTPQRDGGGGGVGWGLSSILPDLL